MASFASSVKDSIKIHMEDINKRLTEFTADTLRDVVEMSPSEPIGSKYAIGLLKNQWYIAFNSRSHQYSEVADQAGTQSLAEVQKVIGSKVFLNKDGFVTFTNKSPYGVFAEKLGWYPNPDHPHWKGTPPYAMMDRAVTNAQGRSL